MTKSRFRINPKYQQGDSIRQNLRRENLRRSYGMNTIYSQTMPGATNDIYSPTNAGIADYEFYPSVDNEGQIVTETKFDSPSILSPALHALFGDYENAANRWREASVADSWRLFQEKRLQAETTNRLNKVAEAKQKLDDIGSIEEYIALIDRKNEAQEQLQSAINSGATDVANSLSDEISQIDKKINDFQQKIKTSLKRDDTFVDLFFDPNRATAKEYAHAFLENFGWDKNIKTGDDIISAPLSGIEKAVSMGVNILTSVGQGIDKAISLTGLIDSDGRYTKRAIKQSLPTDRWTDALFIDHSSEGGTDVLKNKIQPIKKEWGEILESRIADAKESANKYKNGTWYFDPQKINPKFRYYSENNDSGILGGFLPDQIMYSFSEMGSSYSDWMNMAAMIVTDAATEYGVRKLATFAIKRNPYVTALQILQDANGLKVAGRMDEAAKMAKKVQEASRYISKINAAVGGATHVAFGAQQAANMYFINRMREHETNSGVIDAWSNRVLQNSMSRGADLNKVLSVTRQYLDNIGINAENMTDIDLVQHAIAYDIPTGDEIFEKEKKVGVEGLRKVYNDNMSLAAKDYIEALSFLNFTGSFLRQAGKNTSKMFADQTYAAVHKSIIDRTLNKVARGGMNDVGKKLATKHSLDFLAKRAKQLAWVGSLEGIEEGQQELLQSRYARGEYDDYTQSTSLFSLPSVLEDGKLALEVVSAYIGTLYGDPDNGNHQIRRAMQIGLTTGALMGGGGIQVLSNAIPSTGRDNIRNLIGQIKNDITIGKLVGEQYGTAQDDQHLDMFYDAFSKHGINNERLQKSLEDLKMFKGQNVTDAFIDRDIELMNSLWYQYNNKVLNQMLEQKGHIKGSQEHKNAIKLAARYMVQTRAAQRLSNEDLNEYEQQKNTAWRNFLNAYNEREGGFAEDINIEQDQFIGSIYDAYQQYKENHKNRKSPYAEEIDRLSKKKIPQEWEIKRLEELQEKDRQFKQEKALSYLEFAEKHINNLYDYRFVLNAELLQENLKNRQQLLDEISKELGIDVSTSRIKSIIDNIETNKNTFYETLESEEILKTNELIQKLNQTRKKGQPVIPLIKNIAARNQDKYGRLVNQDAIDKLQQRFLLNNAVYNSVRPVAEAFTLGKIDPRLAQAVAQSVSWKMLSEAERNSFLKKENEKRADEGKAPLTMKGAILEYTKQQKAKLSKIVDLAKEYEKHLHNQTEGDETLEGDVDAQIMHKDAAQNLLDFELQLHEDLRRINHREHLRNDASPIEIKNAAENGDDDAETVLEEKTSEESSPTAISDEGPVTNADNSDLGYVDMTQTSDEVRPGDVGGLESSDETRPGDIPQMSDKEKSLREKFGMNSDEVRPTKSNNSDESEQSNSSNSEDRDVSAESVSDEAESSDMIQQLNQNAIEYDFNINGVSNRYDDYLQTRDERTVQNSDQIYTDFLGQTFKYDPSAENVPTLQITREDGTVEPIKLKNGAQLRPGKELSEKLLIPDWFQKTDKYFVIAADIKGVVDISNPDNLIVCMIIQDGENAYATFLEGLELKYGKGYLSDGYKRVYNKMDRMFWSSFVYNGKTYVVKDSFGNIDYESVNIGKQIGIRRAYIINHPEEDPTTITIEKATSWFNALDGEGKAQVDFIVRSILSGGHPVHSNAHIIEQIENLRNTRNAIIDSCVNKDSDGKYILRADGYKIVSPMNPRISDGAINEQKIYGEYIFRNLLDGGFGMSTDLEELTRQISDEEVRLGVGRGERAFKGARGLINKLDPESSGNYEDAGYGHSGKIYYIAKTVSGRDKAITLAEKKFRPSAGTLEVDDVDISFNPDGTIKTGETPSIAEFILRLITDRISDKVFSGMSARNISMLKEDLLSMIVNCDKSTWVHKRDELKWQHFAAKQFFYDQEKNTLVIAIPDKNGKMRHTHYSLNDIYSDEIVYKTVVAMISNNLHWNTPRKAMVDILPTGILEGLREVFQRNPNLEQYTIAGIQDLTFRKQDLFTDDLEYKNVSLVAWMIGTGKLMTTVGDTLFRAPFVYADGPVLATNPEHNATVDLEDKIKSAKKKGTNQRNKTNSQKQSTPLENLQSRLFEYNAKRVGNLLFVGNKDERKKAMSQQTEFDGLVDFAILDVDAGTKDTQALVTNESIKNALNDAVDRYIEYANKEYSLNLSKDQVDMPSEDEYSAVTMGGSLFTIWLNDENDVSVAVSSIDDIESFSRQDKIPVSGVFQTVKTNGTLDPNAAREWIRQTLGLSASQVIVTNGILKGMDDEDVYGVTDVAVSILDDMMKGVFTFSRYAGRGTHYHEAFHYVNLLLHSKQQRNAIYEEYIRLHPEYKNLRKKQIEELLAEDFREYCERIDDKLAKINNYSGPRRWIAKLWNRFIEFIKAWTRRDLINTLYNDIRSAKYSGKQLDPESLAEFKKAYPNGAYDTTFTVPGATKEQLSKLNTIKTYQQFYSVAESVAHSFLDFANVKKVDSVSKINRQTFIKFFEKLKRDNKIRKNIYIQDVIDNPELFLDTINGLLKQYGIVPSRKKAYVEKDQEDEINDGGERAAENEIAQLSQLYDNYTIDQKTNVAFRAKLFLSQVRDSQLVYDDQLKTNIPVQKKDPTTGLPSYVSYDDAWHKITSELHNVDGFGELMKVVQRLSKTKAFFAELYKNLQSIGDDIELQTQICTTVNKHLTTVAHINMESAQQRRFKQSYDDVTVSSDDETISDVVYKKYDQDRNLEIRNDNTLKAKRMLPRDWSKDLFSSPVMMFDGAYHINRRYVKDVLKKQLDEIISIIKPSEALTTNQKQEAFDKAFPKLLDLIQKMAIPFDEDVLTEYLLMHVPNKTKDVRSKKENDSDNIGIDQLYAALKDVIAEPGASTNKSANIQFFINTVFLHDRAQEVKLSKKSLNGIKIAGYTSPKKLDELYSSFGGEIEKMAIAYNNIHPSSRELSVTGPGGKLIYPIGENNFISDIVRWINKNYNGIVEKMSGTKYAENSRILDVARIIMRTKRVGDLEFKLNVFVGMEDEDLRKGVDYFGVNSLEDVVSKMLFTHQNMIILPTMADKKTYYVLELISRKEGSQNIFKMPHDLLLCEESTDLPGFHAKQFSDETLDTFVGYFIDELQSLKAYYRRENIAKIIKNKNLRRKNFHGKVKNGKMDFSGNGGKFRYFYGLKYSGFYTDSQNIAMPGISSVQQPNQILNLNEILEYEYNSQKEAEDPQYGDGLWQFRDGNEDLDGFESVRRRLDEIEDYYLSGVDKNSQRIANDRLYDDINQMLMQRVYEDMQMFSQPGENQLISYKSYKDASDPNSKEEWYYSNRAIPTQLISYYVDLFKKAGRDYPTFSSASSYSTTNRAEDLVLSVVGNYVASSMISTIEIEKVFSGDPAFYKWQYSKTPSTKYVNGRMMDFQVLLDKDTDKIKRLGALLSPGAELRTDFSEEEYSKFPWLRGTKYINATIKDINAQSIYTNELKQVFTRQLLADLLRKNNASQRLIDGVYYDDSIFDEARQTISDEQWDDIKNQAELQVRPYTDITVSDAQVFIRPDMYRKIRMMLGQWSVIPVKIKYRNYSGQILETYYSDEEAFNIIENDKDWIIDPEKAAKVSRLQLFPLKMTYFKNDPHTINSGYDSESKQDWTYDLAYGLYNKMAIFPAFKYLMRSTSGRMIYNRMNRSEDPLDMITFESAVKVGLGGDIYGATKDKTTDISKLDQKLNQKSACVLNGDVEQWNSDENTLNVEVQDIRGLRMQLNTEAHTDAERTIGSQMFKIMFSNIYDDEEYVQNRDGRQPKKGKQIREEIMQCIKALTTIGVREIKNKFYNRSTNSPDSKKVQNYLKTVAENNGLSESVIDILNNGATIESLMQRTLFEQSISSLVNSSVVDINTKGGSAIQQSVFGFVSYGAQNVTTADTEIKVRTEQDDRDNEDWIVLNGGRELNWNEQDGSMEVMLSMNFFKSVVPKKYQHSYKEMRNWLIKNNVIKGFWVERNEETGEQITHWSNPKPFGVGYRIPTQGLSSTFAFTVADVLPEQSGDLIIVPREFTAQTGSDFDVDKLYLSTLSYKNGELEVAGEDLLNSSKGAIANKLIQNYIDVVTDIKNRANARASIDVVTGIIQNSTLPAIRGKRNSYRESMYELTPYFQLRRKQEFSIGKAGIGSFALNITNLALTQYAHISMDFSQLPFKMGALDEVVGEDGIRISDWLSAMVNAHVDVAKDPYVFDLNINKTTYNYANLLLRAGKGEASFLFLAQPALKKYAVAKNNSNGLYGKNLKYEPEKRINGAPLGDNIKDYYYTTLLKEYYTKLDNKISEIKNEGKQKAWKKKLRQLQKWDNELNWSIVFDKNAAKESLQDPESLRGLQFQIMCLQVLDMLQPYAEEISALVMNSRIDTKKFGNTLALQRDFLNEYKKFKYGERSVSWYCTDDPSQNALNRYFESTFLESKLFAATGLVKDILSTQMFTASTLFDDMMYTMMGEIYGFVDVTDKDKNKLHLYDRVYDKRVVQAVSDAAENVIRQRMLFFYGSPKLYDDDSYDFDMLEKQSEYSGPIDFTFGGSIEQLHKELKRLYFGDPTSSDPYEQGSLFKNIASVIQQLENSPIEDRNGRFAGLVSIEGRVVNELLNYLRPQPAGGNLSVPRLLLKKTNRNTTLHEKNKLISSFNFLLKNNNKTIRRLARDIAIFAYYSTYNTNKHNTFFDIVPPEYRYRYDTALSRGVYYQNNVSVIPIINDDSLFMDTSVECKSMLDAICRNFYDDNNIVPEYSLNGKKKQGHAGFGKGEYVGPGVTSTAARASVPICFLTTKNNKPYLKITVNGNTFLYQKRGFVSTVSSASREEKGFRWYAYMLVPKLGVHEGSFNQYELSNSQDDLSIFKQNDMPANYNINRASAAIVKFMKDSQDAINREWKKSNKKGDPQIVMWTKYDKLSIEEQPRISVHKLLGTSTQIDNIIQSKNSKEYIENNADVVIDLSQPVDEQLQMLNYGDQSSAEKDGMSIGFVGNPESDDMLSVIHNIYQTIQSTNANISDIYFQDTEFGKAAFKMYSDYNSFDFADNVYIVSELSLSERAVLEKPLWTSARRSKNGYELSSKGDSRFSARVARFKPGTILFGHDVGGRTIESVYQHGVKQNDWVTDNNEKTGSPSSNEIIKGNTEQDSYRDGYLPLWREWSKQNPDLIQDLMEKSKGMVLTDMFAKTYASQARALAEILNEELSNPSQPEQKLELEGAKQIDKVLDEPIETKEHAFVADDEISDSKFRGVTQEMIEELKRRKMQQQAAINRESNNSEENKGC